MTFDEVDYVL